MLKKWLKVGSIILLSGFSFFYTEKATKIIRNKDPIMINIMKVKDDYYVDKIKPIILNDELYTGVNGCEIDIEKSYNKMKSFGEYNKDLIVMKEDTNENIDNKYVVGGNKHEKKASIIFLIKESVNNELFNYLEEKNIKTNLFVDQNFLEDNTLLIKFLSKNNNIYYSGKDSKYIDEYMLYSNNLIEINSNNKSDYCLLEEKNDEYLKTCNDYNMTTIKSKYIKNDVLNTIKQNLNNGSIIVIDNDDISMIKASINYVISKGFDVVTLDELLSQNKKCN